MSDLKKLHALRQYKGCSCKKSQCIKNYCDCYQSMIICTKYCKCVGCRNTEERNGVPVKPETAKRMASDKGGELSSGSRKPHAATAQVRHTASARNLPAATAMQQQLQQQQLQQQQQQQQQLFQQQHQPKQPQVSSQPRVPPYEYKNGDILIPEICDAVLATLLAQEEETEQVGLNDEERAQVLINEMERCLAVIYKASLPG